ncbi:putative pyrroline-5-carboxylate reductase [Ancylostoma duodenale]|uniref:Putative pyrroline-5-carboxylate reductase n=1 Tax=Ancylostoma duodenale TaxID=51022 RepID=A0A0C2G8E5_9BILA|nr:putative pyrroline-5-carboxylate reductase [Ancylostoma duodenale]
MHEFSTIIAFGTNYVTSVAVAEATEIAVLILEYGIWQQGDATYLRVMTELPRYCLAAGITEPKLLFIGGGNMASALVNGCITSGFAAQSDIAISCRSESTLEKWKCQGFENVFTSTSSMLKAYPHGIIVLAVKPQARHDVIGSLLSDDTNLTGCPLLISILAGVDEKLLEKEASSHSRCDSKAELSAVGYSGPIIRLFPNTAVAIGSGASIICAEPGVSEEMIALVKTFASKVGLCLRVDSRNFNAYGAISGSAPAWVYMFIESLADGGVFAGCSRETALQLAAQTVMKYHVRRR